MVSASTTKNELVSFLSNEITRMIKSEKSHSKRISKDSSKTQSTFSFIIYLNREDHTSFENINPQKWKHEFERQWYEQFKSVKKRNNYSSDNDKNTSGECTIFVFKFVATKLPWVKYRNKSEYNIKKRHTPYLEKVGGKNMNDLVRVKGQGSATSTSMGQSKHMGIGSTTSMGHSKHMGNGSMFDLRERPIVDTVGKENRTRIQKMSHFRLNKLNEVKVMSQNQCFL
jgi:hypothetical protein